MFLQLPEPFRRCLDLQSHAERFDLVTVGDRPERTLDRAALLSLRGDLDETRVEQGIDVPVQAGQVFAAMTGYLVFAWRKAAAATPAERAKIRASLGSLRYFMPQDRRTYATFFRLSITAGIVEEALYRGFVFWYLGQFMPAWAAVVVSALAFGAGHSYQGVSGMIRVTAAACVTGPARDAGPVRANAYRLFRYSTSAARSCAPNIGTPMPRSTRRSTAAARSGALPS